MSESSLGLSEPHNAVVLEYLRFARFRRGQCLKTVQTAFQDLMDSRLVEDTFTSEEVKEMLTGLGSVVKADMESELMHSSHTNVLLLQQLLKQADGWHLTLKADVSAMENRELLEAIAQYEQEQFSSSAARPAVHKATLKPLEMSGGEKLLQMEISRLEEENKQLKQRLQVAEVKVTATLSDRDELQSKLSAAEATPTSATPTPPPSDVTSLQQKISQLEKQLKEKATITPVTSDLHKELAQKSKELLSVRAELQSVREELDKKFSDTAQYVNMRKMLSSKNEQIKELRAQLSK